MTEMNSTSKEAQAKAQFEYDSVSARVDSVKRKLDGGSSSVSYEQLSVLLDEQQMMKRRLDDANDFVRLVEAARPTRAAIKAREEEQVIRDRQEMKLLQKADIDEAGKAIQSAVPGAAPVVDAVRSFAILGKPATITARLADGSQWIIDGAAVRQLTGDEITAHTQMVQNYLS